MRLLLLLSVSLVVTLGAPAAGDDLSMTVMLSGNDDLRAQGMDYMVQQIEFFNRDGSRASARYFLQDFQWVPGDARRRSTGPGLTYLFDESWIDSNVAIDSAAASADVERAAKTWNADSCLQGAPLVRVSYTGGDVTIFDSLLGTGGFGDPFAADVVVAGFPAGMEDFFGPDTLAFSVTFVFVDGMGTPTDVDRDGHMDTALNEIYLNRQMTWALAAEEDGFDLETTALHELGHALSLGHFSAPPESVMSPVYGGEKTDLYPIDHAALCLVHGSE